MANLFKNPLCMTGTPDLKMVKQLVQGKCSCMPSASRNENMGEVSTIITTDQCVRTEHVSNEPGISLSQPVPTHYTGSTQSTPVPTTSVHF